MLNFNFLLFSYSLKNVQMADILKIAKINYVVMNLLANGHKKDSKHPPEFDFSTHRCFPVIKQQ